MRNQGIENDLEQSTRIWKSPEIRDNGALQRLKSKRYKMHYLEVKWFMLFEAAFAESEG